MNELREAVQALIDAGGNKAEAARSLGIAPSTLKDRLKRAEVEGLTEGIRDRLKLDENIGAGTATVDSVSETVMTVEQALSEAGVDREVWEVERCVTNSWPFAARVAGKRLHQVKVYLRRRVSRTVEEAAAMLAERNVSPLKVKPLPEPTRQREQMLLVNLYDAHIGQFVWGEQCRAPDVDLAYSVQRFKDAGDRLLSEASAYPIAEVVIPIGNDLAHFDNLRGETTSGANKMDMAHQYPAMVCAIHESVEHVILSALRLAPRVVRVVYVPGNHDQLTSFHICHWIRQRFRDVPQVEVDAGPDETKYVRFGANLIGFNHGKDIPRARLARRMQEDNRSILHEIRHQQYHTGHVHHNRADVMPVYNEDDGIKFVVNSALAARDGHHRKKGYGSIPAANAFRFDPVDGEVGSHRAVINEEEAA